MTEASEIFLLNLLKRTVGVSLPRTPRSAKMDSKDNTTVKAAEKLRGLSLRKLNYAMSAVTFVISILLLAATVITSVKYGEVEDNTRRYVEWQKEAQKLLAASDYLTEQVRCFAVTGDRDFMNNYFTEANETRRRDNALRIMEENLKGTAAYAHLERAMTSSLELMEREYYSMRLVAEANGDDISDYPEEVRKVELSARNLALSPEDQHDLAVEVVFDDEYRSYKNTINRETQKCVNYLADTGDTLMEDSFRILGSLLVIQQALIIGMIAIILVVIALTSTQVIRPLVRAIPNIENEKPLPMDGAYEYKYLARTYNKMYNDNKRQKNLLNYEATHDPLTGVFNRNGFAKICDTVDFDCTAILLLDIDGFKSINDTLGHDVGDVALVEVVGQLRKSFRSGDVICRYGGDEFAIIMHGVTNDAAGMEIIREKIGHINNCLLDIDEENENLDLPAVSVSAGVAFGYGNADVDDLLKRADIALYEIKKSGKGGVSFAIGNG